MKKILVVVFMLICAASFAFAGQNQLAFYKIDADLATPSYQGLSNVTGIGAGEKVGFAVYVKNVDELRAISVDFTWDITKATMRSETGEMIEEDDIAINGLEEFAIEEEPSMLGTVSALPDVDEDGHYGVTVSKLGGDAVSSEDFGLAYFFVLKTSTAFTESDDLTVTATINALNNGGLVKELGTREFYVNKGVSVETKTWGEIKNKFKD